MSSSSPPSARKPLGEINLDEVNTLSSDAIKWLGNLEAEKNRSAIEVEDEAREQYIVVLISDREIAFRVTDIEAILDVQRVSPVPGVPKYVLGICNVRGEITSVVNLHTILGLDQRRKSRRDRAAEKMVIVRGEVFSVGFLVDSVLDVIRVAEREVVKINAADGELSHIAPLSRGLYARPGEENRANDVILMDTERLLGTKELSQFQ